MQKVRKAVIAAAGIGTRFLPQTKAMPKEMLPIIDRPVIQLVVENVVAAGVEDVIIVTGATKRAIEDHFDRALELENELREKGKDDIADQLKAIAELANIIYVRQKGVPKGNARPVLNAAHLVEGEPFFYFFADDFFTGNSESCAMQLHKAYEATGKTTVALRKVTREDASKYGMADIGEEVSPGVFKLNGIAEKPGPEHTPSEYALVCGYLLTPDIMPLIEQQTPAADGEIRVPDSLHTLAQQGDVYGCVVEGDYHDTGSPELYIETIVDVALKDAELGPRFREYLRNRL